MEELDALLEAPTPAPFVPKPPDDPAIGDDDLVYLNEVSIPSIFEKLKERFAKDEIYTSIGSVLISCNPFKPLPLYSDSQIDLYANAPVDDPDAKPTPPHIFKIADGALRLMLAEDKKQCVIISGESGAGKTEASKALMQYISAVSGSGGNDQSVDQLKNVVLESNPVLEAFGNAMTVRNNNSSRFGKYFELFFSPANSGTPMGGSIRNYLLEKSRVVWPGKDERSYHIFYQVLTNASLCDDLGLESNSPSSYKTLARTGVTVVDNTGGYIDDAAEFNYTIASMDVVGLDDDAKSCYFNVIAAVLHLGNVDFVPSSTNGADASTVKDPSHLQKASQLLDVDYEALSNALLTRTFSVVGGDTMKVPNNPVQAHAAKDALAKDLYAKSFDELVSQVNSKMEYVGHHTRASIRMDDLKKKAKLSIGVLDIFGFEIFDLNLFEQLCINFVNERLQQVFISLTVKQEQEDYFNEGIPWVNVDFFDNQVVIDLIQNKIFPTLDDAGRVAHGQENVDQGFLDSLTGKLSSHSHFKPTASRFVVVHYAGEVGYEVAGFISSNKDTLPIDLLEVVRDSNAPFLSRTLYGASVGASSKTSLTKKLKLDTDKLVKALMACTPHYVRCIKSNELKCADVFEKPRVTHQITYLGLMESIKVRRAGFAFRIPFSAFNARFAVLGNNPSGTPVAKAKAIISNSTDRIPSLNDNSEVAYGKSKIFIRSADSYFALQALRKRDLGFSGAEGEEDLWADLEEEADTEIEFTNLLQNFVGLNVEDEQLVQQLNEQIPSAETLQFSETMNKKNPDSGELDQMVLAVSNAALYVFKVVAEQPEKSAMRAWIEVDGRWVRNTNPAPKATLFIDLMRRGTIPYVSCKQIRSFADTLLMITFDAEGSLKWTKLALIVNEGQTFARATDVKSVVYAESPIGDAAEEALPKSIEALPIAKTKRAASKRRSLTMREKLKLAARGGSSSSAVAAAPPAPPRGPDEHERMKRITRKTTNLMWRISTQIDRKSMRPASTRPLSIRPMSMIRGANDSKKKHLNVPPALPEF